MFKTTNRLQNNKIKTKKLQYVYEVTKRNILFTNKLVVFARKER